jgi:hypothetical protein
MLAHSSGEWIASDWPVCPIAEMASPQRMGAALTYARRYALFTFVGIAGEDDLDAPDLNACGPGTGGESESLRHHSPAFSHETGSGRLRGVAKSNPAAVLDTAQSAALREKLLAEVANLAFAEVAVTWATQALPAKNNLVAADAKLLEEAFEKKLSDLSSGSGGEIFSGESSATMEIKPQDDLPSSDAGREHPAGIDKSVLAVAAPRRYRNREHLRYVAQQPCLLCGRKPSDPHHLGFTQPRALARKVSDEFVVPLCRGHHRAVHRSREERAWWRQSGIDPIKVARRLWKETRGAGNGQSEPLALPRTHSAAASSDQNNEGMSATAKPPEEARRVDVPS